MRKFLASMAFTVAVTMAQSVWALPMIDGTIAFGGDGSPMPGPTWFASTGVSFNNPWLVVMRTGDYAGVPFAQTATFTNTTWGAGTGPVAVPLAQTMWTFTAGPTTYTLTVGTVDNIDRGSAGNDNIAVTGSGTLMITGFADTPGTWSFTAGFTSGGVQNLSFSSGTSQVPTPSTLSLLALGLAGFGLMRHMRKVS